MNTLRHNGGARWRLLLGGILAQFGSIVPRACHLAASRAAAAVFECRVSSLFIGPYCRWNYGDSAYWKKFEPGSSGPAYRSFQDFFSRNLRTPLVAKGDTVWPCEGLLCQVVPYKDVECLRIKGEWMRASKIFAISESKCDVGGVLYNVFLHNRNYHHIHSPVSGRVTRVIRIPGKLFLLRPWAYEDPSFPALRNERVVIRHRGRSGTDVVPIDRRWSACRRGTTEFKGSCWHAHRAVRETREFPDGVHMLSPGPYPLADCRR